MKLISLNGKCNRGGVAADYGGESKTRCINDMTTVLFMRSVFKNCSCFCDRFCGWSCVKSIGSWPMYAESLCAINCNGTIGIFKEFLCSLSFDVYIYFNFALTTSKINSFHTFWEILELRLFLSRSQFKKSILWVKKILLKSSSKHYSFI